MPEEKLSPGQIDRLKKYRIVFLSELQEEMPEEAFAMFQKIHGYLQALVDLEQITEADKAQLVKKYSI